MFEGATEEAYIRRIAEHLHIDLDRSGVEVMDLHGLGGLASDRLMAVLELFQCEEYFSFVSIDSDSRPKPLGCLRNYANNGFLPIGFKVWNPDFEACNFFYDELANVANRMASNAGFALDIMSGEIQQEMTSSSKPVGEAIEQALVLRK